MLKSSLVSGWVETLPEVMPGQVETLKHTDVPVKIPTIYMQTCGRNRKHPYLVSPRFVCDMSALCIR